MPSFRCGQGAQITHCFVRLLFDQNISSRILRLLSADFGQSQHVVMCGLQNAADLAIFDFAKDNALTIVTFDSDFVDISVVKGFPPKVICLKTGNQTTNAIAEIMNVNALAISHFLLSEEAGVLEIMK